MVPEHHSVFKSLLWLLFALTFSASCLGPQNHKQFTFFCPLPLLLTPPNLSSFAAPRELSCPVGYSLYPQAVFSSSSCSVAMLKYNTCRPRILASDYTKCSCDWCSCPGYPDFSIEAALSLPTTLSSMTWPASSTNTDPAPVSRYLMKTFNGIWPHLNP